MTYNFGGVYNNPSSPYQFSSAPAIPTPPVSGYLAWYDASQITGIADGGSLASWSDSSGNGYTMTQATGGDQPTYYKTTSAKLINGLPAVWFNGSTDSIGNTAISVAQPVTIFVVAQRTSGTGQLFAGDNVDQLTFAASGSVWELYAGSPLNGSTAFDTSVHVFSTVANSSSSLFRVNGTQQAAGNAGTFGLIGGLLLSGSFAGTGLWTGPICEVIVYGSALLTASITSVESYLTTKWL